MWDDEFQQPAPISNSFSASSNSQGNGFCVGRGRGFGSMSSLNKALPQVGDNSNISNTQSTWQNEDSGWNEEPSSGNNNTNDSWPNNNNSSTGDTWGSKRQNSDGNVRGGGFDSSRSNTSRACFKCGDEGHMSRECPSAGGEKKRGCYKCGEDGHISRDCTSSGGGGERKRGCFKCGEDGHMSRECPNGGGGGGRGNACYKCGEEGHMSRECPNGGSGGGGERKKGCFKCGDEGHMSRECPSGGDGGERKSGCFKCGEDGHMARDCSNPDTRTGPDGKPYAPPYIPPDPNDDASTLFEGVPTGINFSKYNSIPVDVSGSRVPPAIQSFDSANLCQHLVNNIKRCGYQTPTPVQKHAIPIILQNRDLMACAETGSGKTAAFLLPMLNSMITDPDLPNNANLEEQEPLAVIISPTRELAIQIYSEARKFAYDSVVKAEVVYGGTSTGHQSARIKRGVHILVATPGRLLDFVEKGKVSFAKVRYLVLDEADRMLDMGFAPAIQKMVENSSMPPKGQRRTLMFSATFPEAIQTLASEFLEDYLFLTVGTIGGANTDVEQTFFKLGQYEKRQKLMDILKEAGTDRTLVFVEQKRTADFLASFTSQNDIPTTSIHGDRLQREREEALRDFRNGRMPVLVATAVAARGLDIKDVRHVVNYDLPSSIDEYVHRIGRTGRVGNLGKATSFYDTTVDQPLARSLKRVLMEANQVVPDWLSEDAAHAIGSAQQYTGRGNFGARDVRNQGRSNRGGQTSSDSWDNTPSQQSNANSYSQPIETDENWD